MAAKTWETDFRYDAIQASLHQFNGDIPKDVFSAQHSFCLPVNSRPMVGFTPGKLTLILLVSGFALLGLSLWIMSLASDDAEGVRQWGPVVMGAVCSLSGIACFFVPSVFEHQIVTIFLGSRGEQLRQRAGLSGVMASELGDGDLTKQAISIDGEDHVLVFMDKARRRLLIEGIAARYQIRAEDVVSCEPFSFTNYIGVQLGCRINDEAELLVAIARVSMLYEVTRQLPFLPFIHRWINNRILDETRETIQWRVD